MPSDPELVLVTGATGFVGQHLVRALLLAGYRVRATGRNERVGEVLAARGAEFVAADLADPRACAAVVEGVDVVVHAAARTLPWGRAEDFRTANTVTTGNILAAAEAGNVRRVVHFSSPAVQSRARDQRGLRESDMPPGRFLSPYASTKWESEELVAGYVARGGDAVVLRPKAVYGPGDTTILPRVLEALRSQRIVRFGPRKVETNFTHVDDVVAATLLAVEAPVSGRTFTVADPEPVDVWRSLDDVCERLGYARPRRRLPRRAVVSVAEGIERVWGVLAPGREPPVTRYALSLLAFTQTYDTSAARDVLGFVPRVRFADGLDDVVAGLAEADRVPAPAVPVELTVLNTGWVRTRGWLVGERSRGKVDLPVLCALVQHPAHGWGLVDTGYSPRFFTATSRFPYSLYRRATPATSRPEESMAAQLAARGIAAADIGWIVLTHLDPDHCAGLDDFPRAQVHVAQQALTAVGTAHGVHGLVAHRQLPGLLPDGFVGSARAVDLADGAWGPFAASADLFGDGSVILVGLPGHVPGHVGVVLADRQRGTVLWCADAYWTRSALGAVSRGRAHLLLAHDRRRQRGTYALLRRVRAVDPDLVMVASHDPASAAEFGLRRGTTP